MLKNVLYISLLSPQDLSDLDALIHIHAGSGIIISTTTDGLEISIDLQYIDLTIKHYFVRSSDRRH